MVNSLERLLKLLYFLTSRLFRRKGYGISIIVPYGLSDLEDHREENWTWLKQYWKTHLPGAEIILGIDEDAFLEDSSFSKSAAVNDGVSKAHGDILVIIDADAYISAESVLYCADEIRLAREHNHKLWFIPYRHLYRLTKEASIKVLESDPIHPYVPPVREEDYTNKGFHKDTPVTQIGHWYGAMAQILPREAFEVVGGWDPRFRGWGGEDYAAMRATDTLYYPHKTLPTPIFHLWHPVLVVGNIDSAKRRLWGNQGETNNDRLSIRYYWAAGKYHKMRALVDEYKNKKHNHKHRHKKHKHCPEPPVST